MTFNFSYRNLLMIMFNIANEIIKNREYSVNNRQEILDYVKRFEWCKILTDYYLPNIENIISRYNG